jgi:hypothetical protein
MDGPMSAPPEYFLDTAFAIALASKSNVFQLSTGRFPSIAGLTFRF